MRSAFITFVLQQCQVQPPLWTLEQAIDLLQYFDSCWHLPERIRTSWLDGVRLQLLRRGAARFSTGGMEASHRRLDEHFFRLQLNRDVLTVLMKVCGFTADGNEAVGVFDCDLKRLNDVRGQRPQESVEVRLMEARAALMLLQLHQTHQLDKGVIIVDASTACIRKFGKAPNGRRHMASWGGARNNNKYREAK